MGQRNTSSFDGVEEVAMGRGDYVRLTPEAVDELWARMRAGHAPKPTARELGSVHVDGA